MDFLLKYQSNMLSLKLTIVRFLGFILFFTFGCTNDLEKDIIATIDDIEIHESEFQLRYNFNPYKS